MDKHEDCCGGADCFFNVGDEEVRKGKAKVTFDEYPEWSVSEIDKKMVVKSNDEIIFVASLAYQQFTLEQMERIVDCVNACKKIRNPEFINEAVSALYGSMETFKEIKQKYPMEAKGIKSIINDIEQIFKKLKGKKSIFGWGR